MAVTTADAEARVDEPGPPAPRRTPGRWSGGLPPVLMLAVVAVGIALPLLLAKTGFYFWDDSAAVAVPWYRRMAEDVLAGQFPGLQIDMWRGGNLPAEAATGMWNPIVLGAALATLPISNLAAAITLMKAVFLALMAGGVYLLCRSYGATPWVAAAVGAALPLSGYTLFVDATSWVNGLLISAFTPWVWWAARRAVQGRGSLVWVVVAGYLCGSVGNPYGMLTAAVAIGAVMVEGGVSGHLRRLPGLVIAGVAIVLTNLVVYLPFVLSAGVTYRSNSDQTQLANDEFLSPSLTDLLGASTPTLQPYMPAFGLPFWTVPVMYVSWFLLPLLPWLRWRQLRARSYTGIWVFGGIFLLLVLGPTQIWMFRWPLRLVSVLTLAVGVLWAVLASGGLHRTRRRARAAMSAGIVFAGAWFAWSNVPFELDRHLVGSAVVGVLVAVLVLVGPAGRTGFATMAAGTLGVLALQVTWFPGNYNVTDYWFPSNEPALERQFADRYDGVTVQIADIYRVAPGDLRPDRAYTDVLFGSLYSIADVESLTAYSGIGFNELDATLCTVYQGSTICPQAWDQLWVRPPGVDVPLADLLRAETVVTQHRLIDTRREPAPAGWSVAERTDQVVVWEREAALPWPDGRLSHVTSGVSVLENRRVGPTDERLRISRPDPAQPATLTFARLAWPGYRAEIDGRALPVTSGPSGLLQVELPAGTPGGEVVLTFTPPGWALGMQAMALGIAITALLGAAPAIARRFRRTPDAASPGHPTGPTARGERS